MTVAAVKENRALETNVQKATYTLKPLFPSDWEFYKKIRLESLANETCIAIGEELAHVDTTKPEHVEWWKSQVSNDSKGVVFGLFCDDEIVGLTAAFQDAADPNGVRFGKTYINKNHRGISFENEGGSTRLGQALYNKRLQWAQQQGYKTAYLSVQMNEKAGASRRLATRNGFEKTCEESVFRQVSARSVETMNETKLNMAVTMGQYKKDI